MHPGHQEAVKLRLAGKSYNEIARALDVSKGSLSLWFKNLELTVAAKKLLEDKIRLARERGLFKNNRRRTQSIKIENQRVRQTTAKEIRPFSRKDLLLIGAALYWAEGYNRQENASSPYVSFGNSDPNMVALFLRFLREVMGISGDKMRPIIQVHQNVNIKSAISFWAKISNIPQERFRVTYQISRASKGRRPHNSLPYGTFKINVSSRKNFFRIKGWIDGLIKQSSFK
ncbi:MAG: hypothetical protein WC514_01205 [Candidatus Paceibacterota bacterium]